MSQNVAIDALLSQSEKTLEHALFLIDTHISAFSHATEQDILMKAIAHDFTEIAMNINHALVAINLISDSQKPKLSLVKKF
jgi:hypothetical protein